MKERKRKTDTDRKTDRQTERQTDRETERQTDKSSMRKFVEKRGPFGCIPHLHIAALWFIQANKRPLTRKELFPASNISSF